MVQWDGMVKILGYGISNMSLIEAESGKGLGRLMPYCSPEQIRGEAIDLRSNLFTLGAILYEMVVGHKAFDAADPVALVNQIENDMPRSPSSENRQESSGGERTDHEGARERSRGALSERARTFGRPGEVQGKRQESGYGNEKSGPVAECCGEFGSVARRRPASLSQQPQPRPSPSLPLDQLRLNLFPVFLPNLFLQAGFTANRRADVLAEPIRQQPKPGPLRPLPGGGTAMHVSDGNSDST